MGIRLGHGTYSEFGSGENYFETILKKLDERRNEIQNTIDEYFSEAEKKANELKQISGIVNQNKNAAAAAASSSYENLKECGNRVNICTSLALESENYAQIVKKSFDDISEVFEIIKKIQQNVESLELNARAYANLAENNAALCKNLNDSTGRSAYKSECFASASEEAYEKARVIRERCEQIFSDIQEYEKIIKNAKDYISGEITIKSISANGSAVVPDENKNVNIPLANDTFDGLVTAAEREKLQSLIGFDGTINSYDIEDIKWDIADGIYKVNGFYNGILISSSNYMVTTDITDEGEKQYTTRHCTQILIASYDGYDERICVRKGYWRSGDETDTEEGDWKEITSDYVKIRDLKTVEKNIYDRFSRYTELSVMKAVVGTYTVIPIIKNITAEIKVKLIYPIEYDAFKVSVISEKDYSSVEESDFIEKGKGFRTAAAVFDGKDPYGTELQNIKIDFYLNNIMVLSTMISACFPGNFEKDVRCGALVNFQALA